MSSLKENGLWFLATRVKLFLRVSEEEVLKKLFGLTKQKLLEGGQCCLNL